uniref:Uncharacterized protein n=1 Tax=Anopheles atroparvus TaxID=41427 RepID=A0A240PMQ8_ANOAO
MLFELHEKYSKPEAMMSFVLKLLQLVGIGGTGKSNWIRSIVIVTTYIVVCAVPQLFGGQPDMHHSVRASVELIFDCNIFVGYFMLTISQANFLTFIDELQDLAEYACSFSFKFKNAIARFNSRMDAFARTYTAVMIFIALFYWIVPLPRTYWSYFTKLQTNTSAPLQLMQHLEVNFYWLDNRSSMADYTVFVMIMLPITCLCSAMSSVKLLTTSSSIRYCTLFAHVTKLAVEQLDDISSKEQLPNRLFKVLSMHQRLLRCVHLLDKTLSPMLLLQWSLCVLDWSVTLLYLNYCGINLQSATVIVMFSLITLETFLYCVLGALLTDKGEQLERVLYDTRWYDLPLDVQKNLLLMLRRSQRPVRVTVGKFFQLNLEEFGRMVNLSYSAFVVLKDQIKLDILDEV